MMHDSLISSGWLTRMAMVVALPLAGLAYSATPANAQSLCVDRSQATEQLGDKYSEFPVAMGLTNTGAVLELFASEDGSTWTMMVTMPDGTSCTMAAGESWEAVDEKEVSEQRAGPQAKRNAY